MPLNAAGRRRWRLMALIAFKPWIAKAEPIVLLAMEMDRVTAGTASVRITATAGAFGDRAETVADARSTAVSTPLFDLAYGIGQSRALACCGPAAEARTRVSVSGRGRKIRGESLDRKRRRGSSAKALSQGWIIAYDLAPNLPYWQPYAR